MKMQIFIVHFFYKEEHPDTYAGVHFYFIK